LARGMTSSPMSGSKQNPMSSPQPTRQSPQHEHGQAPRGPARLNTGPLRRSVELPTFGPHDPQPHNEHSDDNDRRDHHTCRIPIRHHGPAKKSGQCQKEAKERDHSEGGVGHRLHCRAEKG
jgi:hypothetical protein